MSEKPSVLLVHGAFADTSSWDPVTRLLQDRGHPVIAVANPLRGLGDDIAYLQSVLEAVPGPVVLAGHSYGGAVITGAATTATTAGEAAGVGALVYVAAYAPDEGETLGQLSERLGGRAGEALRPRTLPGGDPANVEFTLDPALFHEVFAPDTDPATAAALAAAQRPLAAAAFAEPSGPPAWKHLPAYSAISTRDQMIPPEGQRSMAERMNAATIEIDTGHAATLGDAPAIADLIALAADKL